MRNNEIFNIMCFNEKELKEVQLYLFSKNYEWLDSKKKLFFPRENYPLFITNNQNDISKFIWQTTSYINDVKFSYANEYMLSTIRKEKLRKIEQEHY